MKMDFSNGLIYGQMETGFLVRMDEFPEAIVYRFYTMKDGKFFLLPTTSKSLPFVD